MRKRCQRHWASTERKTCEHVWGTAADLLPDQSSGRYALLYVAQFSACYHGDFENFHSMVGYAKLLHDVLRSLQQNQGQFLLHVLSSFIPAQEAILLAHDLGLGFNSSGKINISKISPSLFFWWRFQVPYRGCQCILQ